MKFKPSDLQYSSDGVPILSATKLEAIGTELLEVHAPKVLERPGMTPVMEILEKVAARTGLTTAIEELGHKGTSKILGKVSFSKKVLLLDRSLTDERKESLRFTAAHELGHWVLHRHREIRSQKQSGPTVEFEDDEKTVCRLETKTSGDWLEWQANVFAAAVIMPRLTFKAAVIAAQESFGITKNLGEVWLSDAHYSRKDFNNVVSHIAHTYDVSKSSVEVRLRTLQILVDEERSSVVSATKTVADALKNYVS